MTQKRQLEEVGERIATEYGLTFREVRLVQHEDVATFIFTETTERVPLGPALTMATELRQLLEAKGRRHAPSRDA
jgi:hypothetical protein